MSTERSSPARRVLVVDDDRSAAEAVASLIKALGHEVRIALNGDAALAIADDVCPDVVFLGTVQPYKDRHLVVRQLRALRGTRGAHIVSFDRRSAARADPPQAGFDALLPRPANFSDVARALDAVRRAESAAVATT